MTTLCVNWLYLQSACTSTQNVEKMHSAHRNEVCAAFGDEPVFQEEIPRRGIIVGTKQ